MYSLNASTEKGRLNFALIAEKILSENCAKKVIINKSIYKIIYIIYARPRYKFYRSFSFLKLLTAKFFYFIMTDVSYGKRLKCFLYG